jgi:tRNA G18 (ribose-2'-O)-methylase SpoU
MNKKVKFKKGKIERLKNTENYSGGEICERSYATGSRKNSSPYFVLIAVEQDENSVNYKKLKFSKLLAKSSKIALVFGNEVEGISKEDLKLCDLIAEIPMRGSMVRQAHHPHKTKVGKESLNVSVSAGIVLFDLIDDSVDC